MHERRASPHAHGSARALDGDAGPSAAQHMHRSADPHRAQARDGDPPATPNACSEVAPRVPLERTFDRQRASSRAASEHGPSLRRTACCTGIGALAAQRLRHTTLDVRECRKPLS
jgi:hypothetical protein